MPLALIFTSNSHTDMSSTNSSGFNQQTTDVATATATTADAVAGSRTECVDRTSRRRLEGLLLAWDLPPPCAEGVGREEPRGIGLHADATDVLVLLLAVKQTKRFIYK